MPIFLQVNHNETVNYVLYIYIYISSSHYLWPWGVVTCYYKFFIGMFFSQRKCWWWVSHNGLALRISHIRQPFWCCPTHGVLLPFRSFVWNSFYWTNKLNARLINYYQLAYEFFKSLVFYIVILLQPPYLSLIILLYMFVIFSILLLQTMIFMMLRKGFLCGAKLMLGLIQKMLFYIALVKKVLWRKRWKKMGIRSREAEKRDQLVTVVVQKCYQGRPYLSTSICP